MKLWMFALVCLGLVYITLGQESTPEPSAEPESTPEPESTAEPEPSNTTDASGGTTAATDGGNNGVATLVTSLYLTASTALVCKLLL